MELDIGSQGRLQHPLVAFRDARAVRWAVPASTTATAQEAAPAGVRSAGDRAWIERALEAWRFTSREITGIGSVPNFQGIFFDAGCVLTSADALTSPTAEGVTWSAAAHGGSITVPSGRELPVGITSFASGEGERTFF